jgi:hypothetical protein
MERQNGNIDAKELELARRVGELESAKKLSEGQGSLKSPVVTENHAESMQKLLDTLTAKGNSHLIDVFVSQK